MRATECTNIPHRRCSTCEHCSRICGPGIETICADTLAGVTVTIAGDILHSRVARSNMLLPPRLGARVLLCGPAKLLPELAAQAGPGIEIERNFEAALAQSQAIMMLRIQAERLAGSATRSGRVQGQLSAHRPAAGSVCTQLHWSCIPGPLFEAWRLRRAWRMARNR